MPAPRWVRDTLKVVQQVLEIDWKYFLRRAGPESLRNAARAGSIGVTSSLEGGGRSPHLTVPLSLCPGEGHYVHTGRECRTPKGVLWGFCIWPHKTCSDTQGVIVRKAAPGAPPFWGHGPVAQHSAWPLAAISGGRRALLGAVWGCQHKPGQAREAIRRCQICC